MKKDNSQSGQSLIYTLTMAFLALSLVTLLANGGILLYSNIKRQQEIIISQQQLIAQQASEEVGGFFEEKFRALEATTRIIELPKGSSEQRKLILQSLLATQPSFRQMVLLDERGEQAALASRVSLEISEQFKKQLQEATANQTGQSQRYSSPLYFDEFTNEPVMVLAIPVNIWDFKGILAAEVNLEFMWTLVDQLKVGRTGYVYLVDNEGKLIAAKDVARVLSGANVKHINKVNEFVTDPSAPADATPDVVSYTGLLGTRVVGSYIPLGAPQWAVFTEQPYNEAYAPVIQTVISSLITILVMSILAGLAGVVLARRLAIPLVNLTGTATRIASGETHLQAVGGGAKEITSLASAFNIMTSQLRGFIGNLEARVAERTKELESANAQISRRASQLQAITELSEAIARLQDLNELFPTATKLISERFGFYHVGIFLIDSGKEYAILQAANSEGGQKMLARRHQLRLGTGIVGFAAQMGQPRIALDVGEDAVFFDNPDLPHTRSEVALPMKSRNETIGVLDVQSTEAGAFTTEDLQVLTALANQVSIALENARLLTETRAALTQVQEVYNEFTRTEWSKAVSHAEQPGFRYQTGRIEIMQSPLQAPEVLTAMQNGEVAAAQADEVSKRRPAVAVPVKLRGEVIGILHIESNDPSRTWKNDEISLVEAVAERAAFAMENARLFQDARRRAAKESLISEASARISGALNMENILHTTAEELERVLGGSEVLIQFLSEEKE
ncbi:MAG: GAF domain-containing protein [Chloroflexi bacterium]|nr:GAF domain-containing protein [Chloroflexota bacterium]